MVQDHFSLLAQQKTPKSPASLKRVLIVLNAIMNMALADEKIDRNPCFKIRLPPIPEPSKTILTFAQLGALLRVSSDRLKVPVILCGCVGGLRIGEACAVQLNHFEAFDMLFIDQQVLQLAGGAKITRELKTPQTRRHIPLSPALRAALLGIPRVSGVFLCSNDTGGYMLPNNVTRELADACAKANIPKVSPHELRHTFISLMENELEAPPAVVAALAGKKDKRITSDYSKTFISQKRKWIGRYFEAVLNGGVEELSLDIRVSQS